jgi:ribose transport system permease protein
MSEQALQSSRGRQAIRWVDVGVPAVIVVLVVIGGLSSPSFLTVGNLLNVLTSVSIIGIVALGMMFVVISGSWADLSVPAVIATGAIITLSLQPALGTLPAFAIGIIVGAAAGAINGILIGYVRANPIIVTLGTNVVILGIAQAIVGGAIVYNNDPAASAVVNGRVLGIPFLVVVFALLALCVHFLLARTVWGRWSVATGGNYAAANASGVPVRFVRMGSFVLGGLMAALSGGLLALSLQSVRPVIGSGYEFDALAAIVVGGVSLLGGAGSVWRVLCGMFVVQLLANLMVLHGLPTVAQGLAKGAVIVAAVAIDVQLRKRMGRAK